MNEFNQVPEMQQAPPAFNYPQPGSNSPVTDPYISQMGRPMMSFTEAVKTCLIKKYCCFSGRGRRSEYWWYILFQQVLNTVLTTIALFSYFSSHTIADYMADPTSLILSPGYIVVALIGLALLLPSLGAIVRRLHDTGRSGLWLLIYLTCIIPIVGPIVTIVFSIVMIVWTVQDSDRTENKYGPSPKYQ